MNGFHEHSNGGQSNGDQSGFWDDMPTGRLDRWRAHRRPSPSPAPSAATDSAPRQRQHGATLPAVGPTARLRHAGQHVDPLMRRTGAVVLIIAALVPVALSFRSSRTAEAALEPPATALQADASFVPATPATTISTPTSSTAARRPKVAAVATVKQPAARMPSTAARRSTSSKRSAASVSTSSAAVAASPASRVVARSTSKPVVARVCASKYTVRSGDAWIVIADRAHTTLKRLLAANGATSSSALYPGRAICLPAGAHLSSTATPTVVAAKTAAPSTTVAKKPAYVPARSYTKAQVVKIIREVWPDSLEDEAIRIATRESNLVPTAHNFCCSGLFQIYYQVHARWLAASGITNASQLLDPRTGAYAGLLLYYRSGGFGPWGG